VQTLKFRIPLCDKFQDLPFDELNEKKCSIYVVDYEWNYLFANKHAVRLLGSSPVGKNIRILWQEHPAINFEPLFKILKPGVEERQSLDIHSRSPLTKKAIEILGHPLTDCYYFSIYELPDKESLLMELKSLLKRPADNS
jgi:hypothetical protein